MIPKAALTLAVVLALLVVAPAHGEAQDTDQESAPLSLRLPVMGESTFSMTSTSTAQYRGDNFNHNLYDDDFIGLGQRFDLALQGDELGVSLRLDGFVPLRVSVCPPGPMEALCYLEPDARPERFTISWAHDDWTIELGDSYVVLGRGIALSFRKVDLLGVDDALRGAHVTLDAHRLIGQAVFGISNPQNLDPVTLQIIDDPLDVVAGLSLGTRIGKNDELELAGHAARVWFEEDPMTMRDVTVDVAGWYASFPALADGALALYAEADALRRDTTDPLLGERRDLGRAVYGSAQVQVDRTTVIAEWKDYRNFLVAPSNVEGNAWRIYSAAPALERDDTRLRAQHNARGGRMQIDYAFLPGPWSVSANAFAYGHNEQDADPWKGILVLHGTLGVSRRSGGDEEEEEESGTGAATGTGTGTGEEGESQFDWSVDATGGYRRETYLHDPGDARVAEGDLDWSVVHGEIDAGVALGGHSLEVRVEHRIERRFTFGYIDYVRGGVSLTWSYGGFHVSPIIRWDTERKDLDSTLYLAGEARWEFVEGSHVRLFGGRTPGGRLCSGGICRDVPPFEGVLLELVIRI